MRTILAALSVLVACSPGHDDPATDAGSSDGPERPVPETSITSAPPLLDNSTAVTFAFQSDIPQASFECSVDRGGFVDCTTPHMVSALGDGEHRFEVRAVNGDKVDLTPAGHVWMIDTSMPDTAIDSGPSGVIAMKNVTVAFSSPNAGTGASFECRLDGIAFSVCTSPAMLNNLADGPHVFEVRARDTGGADPTPAMRSWTVDTVAPDTTIVTGPPSLTTSTSATFDVTANEPATFECSQDGGAFTACSDPHTITVADGNRSRLIRAVDAAGNRDATPAARTWTVDSMAPVINIGNASPFEGQIDGPYSIWSFTVNETAATQCKIDNGSFAPCVTGFELNLPHGTHSMTIRATDTAGNVGSATRNWTIDCIPLPSSTSGWGIFHFEETSGQTAINSRQSSLPAVLGDSASVETDDPAWSATGRFGRSLAFNYVERDHVTWTTNLVTNGHVFETWIDLTDSPVGAGGSTLFLSEDGRVRVWVEDVGTQYQVRYSLTSNAGVVTTLQGASVSYNAWHHVLAQFGSNTMTLWVDDIESTGTAVISDAFTYGTMAFGTAADPIAGRMDEIYFALVPLTRAQARDRYCPL